MNLFLVDESLRKNRDFLIDHSNSITRLFENLHWSWLRYNLLLESYLF